MRASAAAKLDARDIVLREAGKAAATPQAEAFSEGRRVETKPQGRERLYRDLHPFIYRGSVIAWIALMATYWVIFGAHKQAAFMVAVSSFFLFMYCLPPFVLRAMSGGSEEPSQDGFRQFLKGRIDTHTGPMTGLSAAIQVLLIPVCIAIATMILGVATS